MKPPTADEAQNKSNDMKFSKAAKHAENFIPVTI